MKYITTLIAAVLLSACNAYDVDVALPDGVSYQVEPLYEFYPATFDSEPAHARITIFYCSAEGWLYRITEGEPVDYPVVENSDGSQVVCDPETDQRTDVSQTTAYLME